jgi:hypothetical protein
MLGGLFPIYGYLTLPNAKSQNDIKPNHEFLFRVLRAQNLLFVPSITTNVYILLNLDKKADSLKCQLTSKTAAN